MINWAAAGAGFSLTAGCESRICAASVKFKQTCTSTGLVPDGAWSLFVSMLSGLGRASEWIMFDPVIDARKASEYVLVKRVVEDVHLVKTTCESASELAKII